MSARLESFQEDFNPAPRSRTYSDREKAETLALLDSLGNLQEVARLTGIPDSTISGWKYGIGAKSPDIPKLRDRINQDLSSDLASDFHEIAALSARVAIKRLKSPQKANKIPFHQLMTGAGIAVDKSQLLRGLPTSINAEVERQELVVILQSALSAGLEGETIDVTPEQIEPVSPATQIEE